MERMTCSICNQTMFHPVRTSKTCGHIVCIHCARKTVEYCPLCEKTSNMRNMLSVFGSSEVFLNLLYMNQFIKYSKHCPFCKQYINKIYKQVVQHMLECNKQHIH
jgi:hypothetical protein